MLPHPPAGAIHVDATMVPEWLHSVASDDDDEMHAIRVELKPAEHTHHHWP